MIAETLSPGGRLVVQTDVLELAEDMRAVARGCSSLVDEQESATDWRSEWTPFPAKTEWENQLVEHRRKEVFRFSMVRSKGVEP